MIGENKSTVKLRLNTLFRLVEINITPFEYIKIDRPIVFSGTCVKSNKAGWKWEEILVCFARIVVRIRTEKRPKVYLERRAEDRGETPF